MVFDMTKSRLILGVIVTFLLVFGLANAQQSKFEMTGSTVSVDKNSNATVTNDAELRTPSGVTFKAQSASTNDNEVTFQGPVTFSGNGFTGSASDAVYSVSNGDISASKLIIASVAGAASGTAYTCSSGTLMADGKPVPGNQACDGFIRVSCTGEGGNRVRMEFLTQTCEPLQ